MEQFKYDLRSGFDIGATLREGMTTTDTFGTTTAALIAGGYDGAYENDVETWNGSSWTEV